MDANANNLLDPSEAVFDSAVGFDPTDPGKLTANNHIGDISAPRTQEFLVGVDREVIPNLGVSATFTYRYMNNFLWNPPTGATRNDYIQTGVFTGDFANVGSVSIPFYGLDPAVAEANNFGFTAQNRPDYHQRYLGFELSATKRMSNRWMARFGFSTNSWNEYFDAADAIMDPTPTRNMSGQYNTFTSPGPNINGGAVVISSSGSGKSGIYLIAPKYTISANGLYQGPWGIDFGANLSARQGYGEPWYRSRVDASDPVAGSKNLLIATAADTSRLPGVVELDVRLEKMFKIQRANVAFDFDVFNVINRATTLGIQYDARVGTYNNVLEIQNPRIARVGLRFSF